MLGADNVDVITSLDVYNRISSSLENVSNTSTTDMRICFFIAGAIILFSMFLTVRQRTKEIGILKAIGAPNLYVGVLHAILKSATVYRDDRVELVFRE